MSLFRPIMKYIWPEMRKYRVAFYSILVLFATRVVLDFIVIPLYFKEIIDIISNSSGLRSVISATLFKYVYFIIGLSFLVALTARWRQFIYYNFLINVTKGLRNFAFQRIERNSISFFSNTFAGSLVTKARRFVHAFDVMFGLFIFDFLSIVLVLTGVFIVLLHESVFISALFFGLIFTYLTTLSFFVKNKIKYDLAEAEQDSRISGRLADVFSNVSAVKFFSARDSEIKSFGKFTQEGARRSRDAMYYGGKIEIIQSIFSFAIQSTVLYVLIRMWLQDQISTGTVVLVQTYMVIILVRLWDLVNALTKFMKAASDMKELVDIFEIVPDIQDPKNPEKLRIQAGHIVFDKVSFKYSLGGDVLSDFSLDIKPGERVGIVGHSGAGKSTITKLLLRLNDVDGGTIRIDDQDIRKVAQDDLRSVIAYVPQEPVLFHRPIRENISYSKPNATEREIEEVAHKAHAHEFISKLPQGYDTLVGERGVKLSGGERQRVAIARAMLKNSPILVLDEATSSLDSVSETYIQDAFNELMKNKTTIVIAHRLSTIQKMDRIIVLDQGQIVEEGTHKELLSKGGLYADLWEHQTGGFLE